MTPDFQELCKFTLTFCVYLHVDVDECLDPDICSCDATCTNTPGSFECKCNDGFVGDGFTCTGVGT